MSNSAESMRIARPESSVRAQVFEAVRSAIVSGYLLPGQRLTEKRLIEETGASRTSIREALRDLENHHLIERTASNSIRVSKVDETTLNDIYDVRAALEPQAVALFVLRASDAQMADLLKCVEERGETVDERLSGALEFDRLLLEGAGNQVLTDILASLHWRVQVVRRMSMSIPGRSPVAWQEMAETVKAIGQRDGALAAELMRVHIESARRAALSGLSKLQTAGNW